MYCVRSRERWVDGLLVWRISTSGFLLIGLVLLMPEVLSIYTISLLPYSVLSFYPSSSAVYNLQSTVGATLHATRGNINYHPLISLDQPTRTKLLAKDAGGPVMTRSRSRAKQSRTKREKEAVRQIQTSPVAGPGQLPANR